MANGSNNISDSKLIDLLSSLNSDEFKQLKYFVESPFHNRNTKVIQLMDVLSAHYPKFKSRSLSREWLHSKVFDGKPFSDLDIRRAMSQLASVVEDFLAWSEVMKQPAELKIAQMRALRNRGLQKHFEKASRDASVILDTQKQTLDHHYHAYLIEQEMESFEEQLGARRSSTRLQQVADKLDLFYMATKLKQSCTMVSYEQVFKHRYDVQLTEEILSLLNRKNINDTLVSLYHFGLLTMTEPENEGHFLRLKSLLEQDLSLDPKEERNIHVLGQNYCIRNVNQGKAEYFNELFDLYRLGLEKGIIQSDQSQFAPAFKNIVSTGLRVRAYGWVENFILTYSELLEKNSRSDFQNFNLARLRFDQERFREAQQLLQDVKFKDLFITLNARILLIKTFYELDKLDLAEHQIKSFQNFIGRQKNLSYHADIFKNNIRYISRLVRLNHGSLKEVQALIDDINTAQTLTEKTWLLSKLDTSNTPVY